MLNTGARSVTNTGHRFWALALGAVALYAVGCGSSDGSSGSGSSGNIGVSVKGQIEVSVRSTPINPQSPEALVFDKGAIQDGQSLDETIKILNKSTTGRLTIQLAKVVYTAPAGAVETTPAFTLVSATGPDGDIALSDGSIKQQVLGEADELTLVVRYTRYGDDLARNGVVVIASDTQKETEQDIQIPLSVGSAYPVASIVPKLVEFPQVAAGETKSKNVRVTNTGSVDLEIRKFNFAGHPDFRFLYTPEGSTDAKLFEPTSEDVTFSPLIVVPPGKNIEFTVNFTPETPDPATGTIVVFTNESQGQQTIELQANANRPCIQVVPGSVQFGAKLVGQKAVLPVEIKSCGNKPLDVTGISLTDNPTGNYALNFAPLPSTVAPAEGTPLSVPINETATFNVEYVPNRENPVTNGVPEYDIGTITIKSNAFEAEVTVDISGIGSNVICPTAVGTIQEGEQVIPQTTLHLFSDGSFAPAGGISKRSWGVQQPPGSQSVFVPSANFPNPTFETNVAGTYKFTLDVWDETDAKSCVPWEGTVLVIPDEAIHVELVWHTPNDQDETDEGAEAGSDVDLHFVHDKYAVGSGFDGDGDGIDDPWFHQPYDCFWFNAHPNWGTFDPTANDDPGLDRDDTDGAGPENLNLAVPQNGVTYRIGVHYWSDHSFGDAYSTVRVYIYQNLVAEFAEVRLSHLDMWCVATIDWPSGQVKVCQTAGGDYKITPNYQNPYFIPN